MERRKNGKPLLSARQVSRSLGGRTVLKEASLEVWAGEVVALIGPDGAGKTTLLDCLNAVVEPTSGEVVFAGRSLTRIVSPAAVALIRQGARFFVLISFLWFLLALGAVGRENFLRPEICLGLALLFLFRVWLFRPLARCRSWSLSLLRLFVFSDAVCAAIWLWRSADFSGVDFFGLFPFYPLLVPGCLVLLAAAPVLFLLFALPRTREAFGHRLRADTAARMGLGRTFQELRLFSSLSVLDNVRVGRHSRTRANFLSWLLGLPGARREEEDTTEKAAALLRFTGLEKFSKIRAGRLSHANRRRLEIARALAIEPALLLLDEPAAGMNRSEKEELVVLIRRIREAGIAVLLVEHDMAMVTHLADHVYVLDGGEVIASGKPETVRHDPGVIEACLGARHATAET